MKDDDWESVFALQKEVRRQEDRIMQLEDALEIIVEMQGRPDVEKSMRKIADEALKSRRYKPKPKDSDASTP